MSSMGDRGCCSFELLEPEEELLLRVDHRSTAVEWTAAATTGANELEARIGDGAAALAVH